MKWLLACCRLQVAGCELQVGAQQDGQAAGNWGIGKAVFWQQRARSVRNPQPSLLAWVSWLILSLVSAGISEGQDLPARDADSLTGLSYTNSHIESVPWSIHLVEVEQSNRGYEIQSLHAGGKAIGLDTLSEQIRQVAPARGTAVAAINGDFYQRERAFAGAPRGLQIVNGELLSGPSGGATFWIDAVYKPHATNVISRFRVTWPNGLVTPFSLNGERRADGFELYTAEVGASTQTGAGRELVLEQNGGARWLPLRIGQTYSARVREVRESGNTALGADVLVLSVGPKALSKMPPVQPGSVLAISTETFPALRGVRTAIGGGPVLLRAGKPEKIQASSEAYEFSSMEERHPRTAVAWNAKRFFLVEVDGRQKHLSVGMTLDELSTYLLGLGCTDAMNLDGGGSATLWYKGEVKNSPCDRMEREIANCIVVLKRPSNTGARAATKSD